MSEDNRATGGQIIIPVETLGGQPLSAVANATSVILRDANPTTPDATILRAIKVCNSVVDVINAVPLPF